MENEQVRTEELCGRCVFGRCGLRCMSGKGCELDMGRLCRCDIVLPGQACEYFQEDKRCEHTG